MHGTELQAAMKRQLLKDIEITYIESIQDDVVTLLPRALNVLSEPR
jgi:hypothetical protein